MITSNDPNNESVDIPVSVNVEGAPDITASEELLDFGEVISTATIEGFLDIGNIGTETLEISSISVEALNLDPVEFTVEDQAHSLEPGDFVTVQVMYSPTVVGLDSAELVIALMTQMNLLFLFC